MNNPDKYYFSNEPISIHGEDAYNFHPYALKIQEAIKSSCITDEQIVFGIYGKWGEGKSSFLNLIFSGLDVGQNNAYKKIIRYKFNPWRYNSENKLLFEFFNGLIKVLNHDYGATNKDSLISKIKEYSKYILSGTTIETEKGWNFGFKFTVKVKQSFKDTFDYFNKKNQKSVESLKESIDEELKKFNYRIVIFIDDVDRLNKKELYHIFRLVKLTASFKNITYILAFDNELVANAIYKNYGDKPSDGKLYIEKIVNIPITLPKTHSLNILKQLEKGLNEIFIINKIPTEVEISTNSEHTFKTGTNRFLEEVAGMEYHISNPRMLVRLLNSFATSMIALKEEVNYSDLLWLELLKLKYQKSYDFIKYKPELFVKHAGMEFFIRESADYRSDLDSHFEEENYSGAEIKEIMEILNFLFPVEGDGLSYLSAKLIDSFNVKMDSELSKIERRINDFDFINIYFSFSNAEKISNRMLEEFFDFLFKDPEAEITKNQFKKIVEDSDKSKMKYELSNRLNSVKDNFRRSILLKLMIKNLDILTSDNDGDGSVFTKSSRNDLIDTIFKNISPLDSDTQKQLIFQFLNKDETTILDTMYTRIGLHHDKFEGTDIQKDLDKVLIKKVKDKYSDNPFFEDFNGSVTRSIFSIWNKLNPDEFKEYIKHHVSKENIITFIKVFPTVWSGTKGETLDNFTKGNYAFLKKLVNPRDIYEIILESFPIIKIDVRYKESNLVWDQYDEKDDLTYLAQFVYWYENDEERLRL